MKYIPHEYQQQSYNFVLSHPQSALLLDMGLGKTIVTLTAIKDLQSAGLIDSVLILCPLRVAYNVWRQEAAKWEHTKDLKIVLLHGNKKDDLLRERADIYLLNYDGLPWFTKELKIMLRQMKRGQKRVPFNTLVCDESSAVKDASTARFKLIKSILPFFRRRVLLTATPSPNSLLNLWSQIYILDQGERLEPFITHYKNRYFYQADRDGFVFKIREGKDELIHSRVADICLRLKAEDHLKMPEKIINTVPLHLPERIRKSYDSLEKEFFVEIDGQEIEAETAAVKSMKLRQLVQGGVYDIPEIDCTTKSYKMHHLEKINSLKDLLDEVEGPAIVAFQFKYERDEILKRIKNVSVIDGDTKEKEAQRIIDKWNKGEVPVLLVHPQALSHGVNLQAGGHIIIWYALTWSLEQYTQLNGRLYRQGQQNKSVIIHHFVMRDTIDEAIIASLNDNDAGQKRFMDYLVDYRKNKEITHV